MAWDISKGRDPRLDFFRGLAMFIIFFAHVRGNIVDLFIPARFGPSDATELFIFCSGFAAAIAFGSTYKYSGFWTGLFRTLLRVWQLYWAHLCLFFTIAVVCLLATNLFPQNYVEKLNLTYFFTNTQEAIIGLFTLTYVPNLFDILPIYIIALLLLPVMVLLKRLHVTLAILLSLGLYLSTWMFNLELPAHPNDPSRAWFFNPFSWQLLFFTAFAFSAGWIPIPKPNIFLFLLALLYVGVWIPISFWGIQNIDPIFKEIQNFLLKGDYNPDLVFGSMIHNWGTILATTYPTIYPTLEALPKLFVHGTQKANFHIFRYLHILALAYLVICIFWNRERILIKVAPVIKVGQQALPTFLTSILLSWIGTIFLDQVGREAWSWIVVNVVGILGLIIVAYGVAWYKGIPWSRKIKTPSGHTIDPTNNPPILVFSDTKNAS